jgi:hypothetical protein
LVLSFSAPAKNGQAIKTVFKTGKDIKSILSDFLSIFLHESSEHMQLAGLITHIEFEGELHALNFPLNGIMLDRGELMQVTEAVILFLTKSQKLTQYVG